MVSESETSTHRLCAFGGSSCRTAELSEPATTALFGGSSCRTVRLSEPTTKQNPRPQLIRIAYPAT